MEGKVCVVTGASSGVGLETTRALARMGARVVMAVRDPAKGEAARADAAAGAPGAGLEVARLDLADLASVRRFAEEVRARHPRLHVLVNNAGVHTARRETTPDGFERTFQTNHLGHFLLTRLLLEPLRAAAPARVVTVASEAHRLGWIRFDDLMGERRWSGLLAYAQSKLANVMFALALARREDPRVVASHAVHPGSVRSGWARGPESGAFRLAVWTATPFLVSPERGARTPVFAATAPGLEGVSGRYLARCRERAPSRAARDVEAQERLWRESARLAGVDWP